MREVFPHLLDSAQLKFMIGTSFPNEDSSLHVGFNIILLPLYNFTTENFLLQVPQTSILALSNR